MDIFKLNYQFQSDFHNFLNVITSASVTDAVMLKQTMVHIPCQQRVSQSVTTSEAEVTGAGHVIDV